MKKRSSKIRPTKKYLKKIFDYNDKGWLVRRVTLGSAKAGSRAGSLNQLGYRCVSIGNANYNEHVIVWIWHNGSVPVGKEIDHKNRKANDNRIENLRLALRRHNSFNIGVRSDNTSRFKGVSFHKRTQTWRADIYVSGSQKSLGHFQSAEDAAKAYNVAAIKQHGDFAFLNPVA